MIHTPRFRDFDYDTLTLGQAWPWFKGAFLIFFGCWLAGMSSCFFGGPFTSPQPVIDYQI